LVDMTADGKISYQGAALGP